MGGELLSLEEKCRRRKARVRILKKLIVISTVSAILLPTALCIVLGLKVQSLQQQVNILEELVRKKDEEMAEAAAKIKMSDGVYANELPEEANADTGEEAPQEPGAEQKTTAYLTFDDGPSENTVAILDILKEYNVKATFFVIGKQGEEAASLYKRIVDEGHSIGVHSYSHKYSMIYDSVEAFAEDVRQMQELIYETAGVRPTLYRFPGGSSNLVSNISMTEFIKYLNGQGITYFDWNVASGDATSQNVDVDTLVNNVLNDVELYQTSVILMHDGAGKATTAEALGEIIEQLQALDIEMRPLDENVPHVQHIKAETVNN